MENSSTRKSHDKHMIEERDQRMIKNNPRACPSCEKIIFGMPGGADAICPNCGYKDPCCSD